jgi:hypothetical protein
VSHIRGSDRRGRCHGRSTHTHTRTHSAGVEGTTPLPERPVSRRLGHISSECAPCRGPPNARRSTRRRTSGRYAFRALAAPQTQSRPRGVARCNPIPTHPSVGPTRPRPGERALRASTEIPASQPEGQGVAVPQTQLSQRAAYAARPPMSGSPKATCSSVPRQRHAPRFHPVPPTAATVAKVRRAPPSSAEGLLVVRRPL